MNKLMNTFFKTIACRIPPIKKAVKGMVLLNYLGFCRDKKAINQ